MLAVLISLALTQAVNEAPAPRSDAPVVQEQPLTAPPPPATGAPVLEPRPNTFGRKAGFFASARVEPGTLVGRVGMGLVLGSVVGGGLATGFMAIGAGLTTLSGSAAPVLITAPFAIASLGVGTALGAALFGDDYGRDMADAVVLALVCAAVSVIGVFIVYFTAPFSAALGVAIGLGLALPAVATPLLVQAFKNEDAPQPTLALTSF